MYAIGAILIGVELKYASTMGGPAAAAIGCAATAMFMVPTYLNWQFTCLAKADELARSSTITTTAAMMRELKEMDYRHSQQLERLVKANVMLTAQIEEAQGKLQRAKYLQRDPRTGRIVSLPVASVTTLPSAPSKPLVILDQASESHPG